MQPPAAPAAFSPLYFVPPGSVVRRIWGTADTVLFIFAGAAAEFALNKAVDWLYFTGRLPADPLARLFSTVEYARRIVVADRAGAERAIDSMAAIHAAVEASRGQAIPAWAYRDVLYMLIAYSLAAFEALERPPTRPEQEEVADVFLRVGRRMGIPDLPLNYAGWLTDRARHLGQDMQVSPYTTDLYHQYRRHLGGLRYWLLRQAQWLVTPPLVRRLLGLRRGLGLQLALAVYRRTQRQRFSRWLRASLLPPAWRAQILALDAPVAAPGAGHGQPRATAA